MAQSAAAFLGAELGGLKPKPTPTVLHGQSCQLLRATMEDSGNPKSAEQ